MRTDLSFVDVPVDLLGREVELVLGDDDGVTVRWGLLREIGPETLNLGGYRDAAGLGEYAPGRGPDHAVSRRWVRSIRAAP